MENQRKCHHPGKECTWACDLTDEDRRASFAQEWEMLRFQDRLRWNRFQTITAIEAGLLLAAYGFTPFNLDPGLRFGAALLGFLLTVVVSLIAEKDRRDAKGHLKMINDLQVPMRYGEFKTEPIFGGVCGGLKGSHLMGAGLAILNGLNMVVLIERFAHWQ